MESLFRSQKIAANDNVLSDQQWKNERVAQALLNMPPINQQIIRLHLAQGWTAEQIASQLNLTTDVVSALIQESIAQIQLLLNNQ